MYVSSSCTCTDLINSFVCGPFGLWSMVMLKWIAKDKWYKWISISLVYHFLVYVQIFIVQFFSFFYIFLFHFIFGFVIVFSFRYSRHILLHLFYWSKFSRNSLKSYLPSIVWTFDICQCTIARHHSHSITTFEPF